jgi:selenocysteine lyase/cysteine desulfurase
LAEMLSYADLKKPSLRISFSHYNKEDIDLLMELLKVFVKQKTASKRFSVFR